MKEWVGIASETVLPPRDYWDDLKGHLPERQVLSLRDLSNQRLNEFTSDALPPPESDAARVLVAVAADGWLREEIRSSCPNCGYQPADATELSNTCPECGQAPDDFGGVALETVYTRQLAPQRDVDWVVAIHGMSTRGEWQEEFSWFFSTTWGRAVPVAVYKYGFVIAGVVMAWRRRHLQRKLRGKLAVLRAQARQQGFSGKPDLIAHSFGTWLIGHVLEDELKRASDDRLEFGRVILAGCILRPDFDWASVRDAGIVEEILNHYASNDAIVPLAQYTIWDSGPSGRRGFDGDEVVNVRAEGYGHSDLFTVSKCVVEGKHLQPCGEDGIHHLEHNYRRYWRPFLTLPEAELRGMPDRADSSSTWRPMPTPLRGMIFPFIALPLVLALLVVGLGWLSALGDQLTGIGTWGLAVGGVALSLLLIWTGLTMVLRRIR